MTKNDLSIKTICRSKQLVDQKDLSIKITCRSKQPVDQNDVDQNDSIKTMSIIFRSKQRVDQNNLIDKLSIKTTCRSKQLHPYQSIDSHWVNTDAKQYLNHAFREF